MSQGLTVAETRSLGLAILVLLRESIRRGSSSSRDPWARHEFDIKTGTISRIKRFIFRKSDVELEWRRYSATREILSKMWPLPLSEWLALFELVADQAGATAKCWPTTVESAPRSIRQYLRALSVTQVEAGTGPSA